MAIKEIVHNETSESYAKSNDMDDNEKEVIYMGYDNGVNSNEAGTLALLAAIGGGGLWGNNRYGDCHYMTKEDQIAHDVKGEGSSTRETVHFEGRNVDNKFGIQSLELDNKIDSATRYTNDKTSDSFRSLETTTLQGHARINDNIDDVRSISNGNALKLAEGLVGLSGKIDKCCCETNMKIVEENSKTRELMQANRIEDLRDKVSYKDAKINQLETIKALGCDLTCNERTNQKSQDQIVNLLTAILAGGQGATATGIL